MTNFIQPGKKLLWTNSTGLDVSAGDVVVVGKRIGIASVDIADGESGILSMEGVFELTKATDEAFAAQGVEAYWNTAIGKITASVGSNKKVGYIFATAIQAATTVNVKINA